MHTTLHYTLVSCDVKCTRARLHARALCTRTARGTLLPAFDLESAEARAPMCVSNEAGYVWGGERVTMEKFV